MFRILWLGVKLKRIFSIIFICSLVSACSLNVGNLTVASTKKVDVSKKFVKGIRVTGYDRYPVIMFPLGVPSVGDAISDALIHNRCSVAMTDVVVKQLNYNFMVGLTGIKVEGDLLLDPSLPGCQKIAG